MADVVVKFTADASDLTQELERIDDKSGAAAAGLRTLARASGGTSEQLEGTKFAAQAAGGKIGEMAGRVENAGRALSAFATNPVALGTAAVVGLGAAAALSGAAVVAAFVGITRAADEARESLEEVNGIGISDEDVDAIVGAAAALDAVGKVVDLLVASVGAEFAPIVEEASLALVTMGLIAVESFNSTAKGADLVARGMVRAIEFGINPLNATLITTAEVAADLARALGYPNEALEEWIDTMNASQTANVLLGAGQELLAVNFEGVTNKAKLLIEEMKKAKSAQDELTESTKLLKDEYVDFIPVMGEVVSLGRTGFRGLEADATGADEALAKMFKGLDTGKLVSGMGEVRDGIALGASAIGAFGDAYEAFGGKSEAVHKAAFIANRASMIANAVMTTAASIPMALATYPGPAGPIAAGIYAGIGAANIATIVATSFGGGGAAAVPPVVDVPTEDTGGATSGAIIGGAHGGGQASAGVTRSASVQYEHRIFDLIAGDSYPGSAFDPVSSNGQLRHA